MNFLECILKILDECQVSKSIIIIFESRIKTIKAVNSIAATAAAVVAKSEKATQEPKQVSPVQGGSQEVTQMHLNKKNKEVSKGIGDASNSIGSVGLKSLTQQSKTQDMSILPSPKLASMKSVPTTKHERLTMAATTTYKDTKLGSLWSIKETASQNSSQRELFNSQFSKMRGDVSKTSEDFMSISLVEKNKELNERMRHRSFYSSFNKTTQITSKKRKKDRESEGSKELENKLKKTRLTMDTKLLSSQPTSQPVNKISSQGIKLFEKLKQKETASIVLESKPVATKVENKLPEKKEDQNHLKVPMINPIFAEW